LNFRSVPSQCLPNQRGNSTTLIIIGGGPAGVAILFYLSLFSEKLRGMTIVLFERKSVVGPGSPHGDPSDCLLVNMVLAAHTVHPFNPLHFVNWLYLKYGWTSDDPVPRKWFGQYLSECHLEAVERLRSNGVAVEIIFKEVVSLQQGQPEGQITVHSSDGLSFLADFLVLALGHQQPAIPTELFSKEINHV